MGEGDYRDGVEVTPEQIFRWSDENKSTPKTAAPSIEDAVEKIGKLLEGGNEVLCFSISETMSSSLNIMRLAIEELNAADRAVAFDSKNLSGADSLFGFSGTSSNDHITTWRQPSFCGYPDST